MSEAIFTQPFFFHVTLFNKVPWVFFFCLWISIRSPFHTAFGKASMLQPFSCVNTFEWNRGHFPPPDVVSQVPFKIPAFKGGVKGPLRFLFSVWPTQKQGDMAISKLLRKYEKPFSHYRLESTFFSPFFLLISHNKGWGVKSTWQFCALWGGIKKTFYILFFFLNCILKAISDTAPRGVYFWTAAK